jgi:riboflavin synthase
MFTGLVESMGAVRRIDPSGAGKRLTISAPHFAAELEIGESVSVSGACLTVIGHDQETCQFEAGPETLQVTHIGELKTGDRVNLERALRVGDRLGGHLVQGHVDGVGRIVERRRDGEWEIVWFSCPGELTAHMIPKGSIAVDGVSLTIVQVSSDRFSVMLIPHTLANTTLGFKAVGASVNLETDLLAKYVAKSISGGGVSRDTLMRAGFLSANEE